MRVICSGPQQDQDTEEEGRGERQEGAETENGDKMSRSQGGSREAEEQRGGLAAQCQDPEITIKCSSHSSSKLETSILSFLENS